MIDARARRTRACADDAFRCYLLNILPTSSRRVARYPTLPCVRDVMVRDVSAVEEVPRAHAISRARVRECVPVSARGAVQREATQVRVTVRL